MHYMRAFRIQQRDWHAGAVLSAFATLGLSILVGCSSTDRKLVDAVRLGLSVEPVEDGIRLHVGVSTTDYVSFRGRFLEFIAIDSRATTHRRLVELVLGPDPGVPNRISVPYSSKALDVWLPVGDRYLVIAQIGPVDSNAIWIDRME